MDYLCKLRDTCIHNGYIVCWSPLAWTLSTLSSQTLLGYGLSCRILTLLACRLSVWCLVNQQDNVELNNMSAVMVISIAMDLYFIMTLPSNGCLNDVSVIPRFQSFWMSDIMWQYNKALRFESQCGYGSVFSSLEWLSSGYENNKE
jgi:hypothetical protein